MFVHANMLKHVDADIEPAFAWGRTKSLSLPNDQFHIANNNFFIDEAADKFVDEGTHCDQLASADIDGNALKAASPAIRRRAIMERGLAAKWHGHGGGDPLALGKFCGLDSQN